MQKLIETLKGFGIEIPEDKHAEVKKALSAHYKNAAEHEKIVSKLETERDNWKTKAETAEETLKGFEGKDFDTITRERDEWKKKAEEAEKDYSEKMAEREFNDLLKEVITELKGKNEKAIRANLDVDALMKSRNQREDVRKAVEALKSSGETEFLFSGSLEDGKARFTEPNKSDNGSDNVLSQKDILKIKDGTERQKAWGSYIKANPELFSKG